MTPLLFEKSIWTESVFSEIMQQSFSCFLRIAYYEKNFKCNHVLQVSISCDYASMHNKSISEYNIIRFYAEFQMKFFSEIIRFLERRRYVMTRKTDKASASPEQHNGGLIIQASTSKRTYPVSGASVTVTKKTPAGVIELYKELTDISGMTPPMSLPGIPEAQTLSPSADYQDLADKYSYDIVVTHPKYVTMMYYQVPVYEGVISVQGVDFIPKAASGAPDVPIKINERQNVL